MKNFCVSVFLPAVVLAVDDNAINLKLLSRVLETLGRGIIFVSCGRIVDTLFQES